MKVRSARTSTTQPMTPTARPLRLLLLIAFIVAGFPLHAAAADSPLWKDVSGWQIRVDRTVGSGCFAATVFEGDTGFRIGLNKVNSYGYVILGDDDWQSLEVGKDYPLTAQFDSEGTWEGTARAISMGPRSPGIFLMWTFSDPHFFAEFARKDAVTFAYEGKTVVRLSLKGSAAAMAELLNCQEQMDQAGSQDATDPLAHKPDADPFAHKPADVLP